MIPYGRQSISEDDIAAVVEVLRSDWLTQGPAIERFERASPSTAARACDRRRQRHRRAASRPLWPSDSARASSCGPRRSRSWPRRTARAIWVRTSTSWTSTRHPQHGRRGARAKLLLAARPALDCPMSWSGPFGRPVCDMARRAAGRRIRLRGDRRRRRTPSAVAIGPSRLAPASSRTWRRSASIRSRSSRPVRAAWSSPTTTHRRARCGCSARTASPRPTRDERAEGAWYYEQIALGYNYRMTDIQALWARVR